ncbi:nuclease-related domain-containing protein [Xanthomonas sp. MUS 060]|uniref:nuclease-related domain-containing protein n=1 Tax=Xanthomonas sp. MUS 060 TaxID=1588031 RepID=UPI0013791830|nr:nuclease-related domain-containing protein [Xanthomonas sp. MUS 060]
MTFVPILIVVTISVAPLAITLCLLTLHRRWRARDGRRSPIANKRIHGAGEQLRKRIEEHGDQITDGITLTVLIGPYLLSIWALLHVDIRHVRFGLGEALFLAVFVAISSTAAYRIIVHSKRRRDALQGLRAELYTAQELNRLQAHGCLVFHDVPGDGFNLDHVVIGATSVYAVETKSFRKPRAGDGKDHFKVIYDGTSLAFPDFRSDQPIKQAKQQAEWLRRHLQHTLGQTIPVKPALALPGWWIEGPIPKDGVRAFNPAGRGGHFMAETRCETPLDPATLPLIAQVLALRYPLES